MVNTLLKLVAVFAQINTFNSTVWQNTKMLRFNTVNGSSIAMLKVAGTFSKDTFSNISTNCSVPTSNGFHCCQRSTCGIKLIYHRPA